MIRLLSPLRAGALLFALAGLVGACSGGATSAPGVATLASAAPGSSGSPSASPTASADPQQAMLDYARCMREHGIDMPDPVINQDGSGAISMTSGSATGSGPSKSEMDTAQAACQHFMDSAFLQGPAQEMSQADQDAMLAYSKCMRDHGIDMPDPVFDGKGGVTMTVTGDSTGLNPTSTKFQDAQATCQKNLPGAGSGGPGIQVMPGGAGSAPGSGVAVPAAGN
jgi:hypothetical protein